MRRQIDLAADDGLSYWAFDWCFHAAAQEEVEDSKHTSLNRFVDAPNNSRLQFCLLVANHDAFELRTIEIGAKLQRIGCPIYVTRAISSWPESR